MIALLPLQVDQKVQDSFKASDQEFQDKFQDSRSRVWRQFQGKWRNIVSIHEASEHCSHDPTASVRVVLSMVVFLGRLKLNMTSVARAHDQPSAVPPSACQFQSSAAAPSADQPSAVAPSLAFALRWRCPQKGVQMPGVESTLTSSSAACCCSAGINGLC